MRSLSRLRERFGRVHVNLGEPIHLDACSSATRRNWRTAAASPERPRWVGHWSMSCRQCDAQHQRRGGVTPVNLLAWRCWRHRGTWHSPVSCS